MTLTMTLNSLVNSEAICLASQLAIKFSSAIKTYLTHKSQQLYKLTLGAEWWGMMLNFCGCSFRCDSQ